MQEAAQIFFAVDGAWAAWYNSRMKKEEVIKYASKEEIWHGQAAAWKIFIIDPAA